MVKVLSIMNKNQRTYLNTLCIVFPPLLEVTEQQH